MPREGTFPGVLGVYSYTVMRMRVWERAIGVGAGCCLLLLIAAQVVVWQSRVSAERLLGEMRSLEVGRSTGADVQALEGRWGRWALAEGPCGLLRCDLVVDVGDVYGAAGVSRLARMLGAGHEAGARLQVTLRDGFVTRVAYTLTVQVPRGYGGRWDRTDLQRPGYVTYAPGSYNLIARAVSSKTLEVRCCSWPAPARHPAYVLNAPGVCVGCLALFAEYQPQASAEVKRELTGFNFDCMTRWTPCADEVDIMPEAGKQYVVQQRERWLEIDRLEACRYSVGELARAALNAVVVRAEPLPDGSGMWQLTLVRALGKDMGWKAGETRWLDISSSAPLTLRKLQGRDALMLVELGRDRYVHDYPCGVFAATEGNVAEVTRALAFGEGRSLWDERFASALGAYGAGWFDGRSSGVNQDGSGDLLP